MIQNIAVIGAGTMGHAIAGCFALYGYDVKIYESFEEIRNTCLGKIKKQYEFLCEEGVIDNKKIEESLKRLQVFEDLKTAVESADYIIEAIPEVKDLKQDLFKKLFEYCKQDAIIASNTSSISFKDLTEQMKEEEKARVMVCHWYNPAHLIPLVELSCFGNMPEEKYEEVEKLYHSIEKRPAKVLKDIPGLLANRIQQGIAREVFSLMEMGAADAKDIDTALKYGPAFRYATTGQLEVADFGGLDIWCTVGDNLLAVMDASLHASDMLREKVKEGKLGFKTGEGFYSYKEEEKEIIQKQFNKRLLSQLQVSKKYE
ncbi:MAG: 3-hydroxyacyl-CoA dehydrogenase family protein [Lachnospiraceae bacterium]